MADPVVTNPKVAGLEPRWRRWPGASVLFDNPGVPPHARLEDSTAPGVPEQRLYDDLAVLVDAMRPSLLRTRYAFCPLPRTAYHVTVCDGPNAEALAGVAAPLASRLASLLDGLPDSVDRVAAALSFAGVADVVDALRAHPVTLAADALVIWGSVLAARLIAPDAPSREALAVVTRARDGMAAGLGQALGMEPRPWRPHVSLGYFANPGGAQEARAQLATWNQWLEAAGPARITYRSAALYGFTDMVSFVRAGS